MSVELSYRVIHLAWAGGSVRMVLEAVKTVPPEEIESARLESEGATEVDIDDAGEQLQKVEFDPEPEHSFTSFLRAIKKEFPGMMGEVRGSPYPGTSGGSARMMPVPHYQLIDAYLTPEQYDELGSPPLLSIVKINMKLGKKGGK